MNHKYLKNSHEIDLKQSFAENINCQVLEQNEEESEDEILLLKEEFQFLEKKNILNLILNFTSDKKLINHLKAIDREKVLLLKYLALKEDQQKIKLFEKLSELIMIKNSQKEIKNYVLEKNNRRRLNLNENIDLPLKKTVKVEKGDQIFNLVGKKFESFFNIEQNEKLFLDYKREKEVQPSKGEIIENENDYYFQGKYFFYIFLILKLCLTLKFSSKYLNRFP